MSIKCMNWAWSIPLSPSIKLVLLSLSDNADDDGECFPSVQYIAKRCCISTRSVRRILNVLEENSYLTRIRQYRKDGSNRSNLYVLNFKKFQDDKLSLHINQQNKNSKSKIIETAPCHKIQSTDSSNSDIDDRTLITKETSSNPTTTDASFEWPDRLLEVDRQSILKISSDIESVVVQLLIDELAGQLKNVTNPVGYFHSLLNRYLNNEFVPAISNKTKSDRAIRFANQRAIENAEKEAKKRIKDMLKKHKTNDDEE